MTSFYLVELFVATTWGYASFFLLLGHYFNTTYTEKWSSSRRSALICIDCLQLVLAIFLLLMGCSIFQCTWIVPMSYVIGIYLGKTVPDITDRIARSGWACVNRHDWVHCKCRRCDTTRDDGHLFDTGCTCSICGLVRNEGHLWVGCECHVCRITRSGDEASLLLELLTATYAEEHSTLTVVVVTKLRALRERRAVIPLLEVLRGSFDRKANDLKKEILDAVVDLADEQAISVILQTRKDLAGDLAGVLVPSALDTADSLQSLGVNKTVKTRLSNVADEIAAILECPLEADCDMRALCRMLRAVGYDRMAISWQGRLIFLLDRIEHSKLQDLSAMAVEWKKEFESLYAESSGEARKVLRKWSGHLFHFAMCAMGDTSALEEMISGGYCVVDRVAKQYYADLLKPLCSGASVTLTALMAHWAVTLRDGVTIHVGRNSDMEFVGELVDGKIRSNITQLSGYDLLSVCNGVMITSDVMLSMPRSGGFHVSGTGYYWSIEASTLDALKGVARKEAKRRIALANNLKSE